MCIFNWVGSMLRYLFLIGLHLTVAGKVCGKALNFSEPVNS